MLDSYRPILRSPWASFDATDFHKHIIMQWNDDQIAD